MKIVGTKDVELKCCILHLRLRKRAEYDVVDMESNVNVGYGNHFGRS